MANITIEIVLKMHFLIVHKVKINFANRELIWKTCTLDEALPTTKQV